MDDGLRRRVAAYVDDNGLLPAGASVLALVSGGADSTCLMHLLPALHPGRTAVLSFDHGLRPGAAGEAAAVIASAGALGLDAWSLRLGVDPGPGLQERARQARYAAARAHAAAHGFGLIATGHTASDQAETVLFRLARGTGRTGAMGMAPESHGVVRPLLCVTRDETRAWCADRGLAVVDDPSNDDARFARTRVRHGLLRALDDVHPGAELAVARFADRLRDEGELLDAVVDAAWERCAAAGGLSCGALAGEHPAVARLLVRRLLDGAGVAADAARVDRVLALARDGGRPVQVPGGLIAVDRGVVVAERPAPGLPPDALLGVPGTVRFGRLVVRASRGSSREPTADRVALTVDGPLTVRSARPGDRIPLPDGGRRAVGRLLADAGVPHRHRGAVPVVARGDRVVWVAGYRADPTLLAAPGAPATLLEVTPA
jgi:tRNA(Ile)-lysidine synthase